MTNRCGHSRKAAFPTVATAGGVGVPFKSHATTGSGSRRVSPGGDKHA